MTDLNDDQGLDNQQYYEQILRYLEDPTQENMNAQWVKIQAANYFLRNGELFYGRRRPRKVLLDEQTKTAILQQIHVDEIKGFHNGVKKMHRILQQKHFWRYSYKSISEYVQNCEMCKSNASPIIAFEKPYKVLTPWNEIEFHQLKPSQPSPEDHLLLVIYDPASGWVSAAAVLKPCSCDVAEFLFENFSNYGVALCTVYGFNSFEFMELKEEFNKLISITETASTLNGKNLLNFSEKESAEFNVNLRPRIDAYLQKHPEDWNKRTAILGWLWKLRNEIMDHTSALSTMSKHCFAKPNNSGNSLVKPRKKTKQSRHLANGKHSDSNIALQLHTSCSEERLTRSSNIKNRVSQHHSTNNHSENSLNYSVDNRNSTSTTVAAVRALIAQSKEARKSKEERQKRGEYNSYTPEIREAIAVHALRHGTHSAARTFSASLGFSVSYSSVRNFVQAHHAFSSQLKLEIGRYAAECGIDATQKFYTAKLNKPITTALIRKFRRSYLRMTPANQLEHHSGSRKSTSAVRHLFCTSVREEIGKYAAINGVQAAVRHFSDKLQFSVKESTVRKFKKIFGHPAVQRSQPTAPTIPPPPPPLSHPHSQSVPVPPLSVLQQQTPEQNYYHQPYGHYTNTHMFVSQQPVNNYQNHHQNMYHVMSQPVPPYPSYSSLPPPPQYQPSVSVPLPAYSRNWSEECSDVSTPVHHQLSNNPSPPTCLTIPRPPSPTTSHSLPPLSPPPLPLPTPLPPPLELNQASKIPVRQEKTAERKKKTKKSERGSYATYSPQFRLEIGRFAVEHGCQEAADYFKERVGHEIPESTVRGLRDKYVAQQRASGEEVSSLNVLPRGRPLRLGPHDEAVQECIRELKRSGERVNAFVAMATARQVLLLKEPGLLTEFGGPVKLTTNWAKSFLKRIGINKENSSQNSVTSVDSPTQTG